MGGACEWEGSEGPGTLREAEHSGGYADDPLENVEDLEHLDQPQQANETEGLDDPVGA